MTGPAHAAAAVLLALAVAIALLSSLGVLAMRDPFQRLHYLAPPATLGSGLVVLAVFLDEPRKQVGLKAAMVALLVIIMNAVVTHATARAALVRLRGRWPPDLDSRQPAEDGDGRPGD